MTEPVDEAITHTVDWPTKRGMILAGVAFIITLIFVIGIAVWNYYRIDHLQSQSTRETNSRIHDVCEASKANRDKLVKFIFDFTEPMAIPAGSTPTLTQAITEANAAKVTFRKDTLAHFPVIACK